MNTVALEVSPSGALRRLLDRQAICDVVHSYCRCVDLLDADGVAALFDEHCTVDDRPGLGPPTVGSAAVRERLDRGLRRFAATSHHVSNIDVDLADDGVTATSVACLIAWHRFADGTPDAILYGQYHDTWIRVDESWRIATRTLKVAGQTDFDVEWPPIGRGTGDVTRRGSG